MTENSAERQAIGVAVAQFAPGADDGGEPRRDRAADAARRPARRGARRLPRVLQLLPSTRSTTGSPPREPIDGPFVRGARRSGRETGCHIVAGLLEQGDDPAACATPSSRSRPTRALVATYRKLHLYDAFGSGIRLGRGRRASRDPETFDRSAVCVRAADLLRHPLPRGDRRLVDAGADVVLVPAEWVRGPLKEHHWRTLVHARARSRTRSTSPRPTTRRPSESATAS